MNQLVRMPLAQEEPARFTAEEFMEIAHAAPPLRDHPGRIDLVEGIIVRMSPPNYPHVSFVRQVFRKLDGIFGDGLDGRIVAQDLTTKLATHTVRCPDVAVFSDPGMIRGIPDALVLLLAVEVADSSLREDLAAKRLTYAEAGVPHYWVVDVNGRQTHVFGDVAEGDYRSSEVVPFGEPLPVPGSDGAITLEG